MGTDYQQIDQVLTKARAALGQYCMHECKAYCCRKGYLPLKKEEVDIVTQNRTQELYKKGMLLRRTDGSYSLFMGNYEQPCPSLDLKSYSCTIHTNQKRPLVCRDFPVFRVDDIIFVSQRCPAVQNNFFYAQIYEWKAYGFKVIVSDRFYDSDLFTIDFKSPGPDPSHTAI